MDRKNGKHLYTGIGVFRTEKTSVEKSVRTELHKLVPFLEKSNVRGCGLPTASNPKGPFVQLRIEFGYPRIALFPSSFWLMSLLSFAKEKGFANFNLRTIR